MIKIIPILLSIILLAACTSEEKHIENTINNSSSSTEESAEASSDTSTEDSVETTTVAQEEVVENVTDTVTNNGEKELSDDTNDNVVPTSVDPAPYWNGTFFNLRGYVKACGAYDYDISNAVGVDYPVDVEFTINNWRVCLLIDNGTNAGVGVGLVENNNTQNYLSPVDHGNLEVDMTTISIGDGLTTRAVTIDMLSVLMPNIVGGAEDPFAGTGILHLYQGDIVDG